MKKKLNPEQEKYARDLNKKEELKSSQENIGNLWGVSQSTISNAVRREENRRRDEAAKRLIEKQNDKINELEKELASYKDREALPESRKDLGYVDFKEIDEDSEVDKDSD